MHRKGILQTAVAWFTLIALVGACSTARDQAPQPADTPSPAISPEPVATASPLAAGPRTTPTVQDDKPGSSQPIDTPAMEGRSAESAPAPTQGYETAASPLPPEQETRAPTSDLFAEMYFVGGGGGGTCLEWLETQPEGPAIGFDSHWLPSGDAWELCLLGFPVDEQISVSFYAPDGDLIVSGDFDTVGREIAQLHPGGTWEAVGSASLETESSMLYVIDMVWPSILPSEGLVTVTSASVHAEAPFKFAADAQRPRVSAIPVSWEDGGDPFIAGSCFAFSAGDKVEIVGSNFEANTSIPLAIYLSDGSQGRLVRTEIVNTDSVGNISTTTEMQPIDPRQYYFALAWITSDPEEACLDWVDPEEANDYRYCYYGPLACYRAP